MGIGNVAGIEGGGKNVGSGVRKAWGTTHGSMLQRTGQEGSTNSKKCKLGFRQNGYRNWQVGSTK